VLKVGDRAPDFTAQTTDGRTLQLASLRGRPVVIYFFPKAFTPGCTRETAGFRDAYPDVQRLGAEIVGVSIDGHKTQCDFADSLRVTFPMVGDDDHSISDKFRVVWPILGVARRVTFVIDAQGIIRGVFRHEVVGIGKHVDESLALLEKLRA
jgi:thioredoxin-dependent peroxiredoxin